MKNAILLDIDGVLVTTPSWKADTLHRDGYSDFNSIAVTNLNTLLRAIKAEIWLTSSRRFSKTLVEFNTIFQNRNIEQEIKGFIPGITVPNKRIIEVDSFLDSEPFDNFIIIDDDNSLQDLRSYRKDFWVRTFPHAGFDNERLSEALIKVTRWKN